MGGGGPSRHGHRGTARYTLGLQPEEAHEAQRRAGGRRRRRRRQNKNTHAGLCMARSGAMAMSNWPIAEPFRVIGIAHPCPAPRNSSTSLSRPRCSGMRTT